MGRELAAGLAQNLAEARIEVELLGSCVELLLRARFASSFRTYLNALRVATRYEQQIVPEAQSAYDTYLRNFRGMAAAYPQVLIAQRTLFQVRAEYVEALVNTWQNAALLQGYMLSGALRSAGA